MTASKLQTHKAVATKQLYDMMVLEEQLRGKNTPGS